MQFRKFRRTTIVKHEENIRNENSQNSRSFSRSQRKKYGAARPQKIRVWQKSSRSAERIFSSGNLLMKNGRTDREKWDPTFCKITRIFCVRARNFTAQKVKNLENSGNAICPGSSDETPPNGKWRSSRKFPKSRSFFSCSKIISKNVRGKICKFACAFFCARNKKIRKFQK